MPCSRETAVWGCSWARAGLWEGVAAEDSVALDSLLLFRAKLYMADLESGLHYLLRVELATHRSLAGAQLKTLRDFVTVIAKVRTQALP